VINLTTYERHRREFDPLIPIILQFKTNTFMSSKNGEIWVPVALCLVYTSGLVLGLSMHSAAFFSFCNACKTEQF